MVEKIYNLWYNESCDIGFRPLQGKSHVQSDTALGEPHLEAIAANN
jgi:hypothetical protein